MEKEKFVRSTVILIIGGFITKLLGMIIRVITTRLVGEEGIGIYMLIMPTFFLFITLAQLGFPIAISKLVSEGTKDNKKIVLSIIPISLILNIILIIVILILAPVLSKVLLNDERTLFPLMAISIILPFISISSIIRGYFFGKERMIPHTVSQIIEQVTRLIIMIILIPIFLKHSLISAIIGIILVNAISEICSIIVLIFYLPKKIRIKMNDFVPKSSILKEVLNIGVPTTGSRLIGSFGYFLEPILLTQALLYIGYSNNYIVLEYGILTGYVFPLLLLPGFFSQAIASALLPVISNNYVRGKKKYVIKKIKQGVLFSLLIGLLFSLFLFIKPNYLLNLLFNTNKGVEYIRILIPFFLIFYIQTPLTSSLQAMGKAKDAMMGTFYGMIVKTTFIFILSLLKIGMYGFLIGSAFNIFIVTINHYLKLKKHLS
ncbi:MAG: oligosaccharide flippase family protein [Bacilli bacterium]